MVTIFKNFSLVNVTLQNIMIKVIVISSMIKHLQAPVLYKHYFNDKNNNNNNKSIINV